ncbi:MAG: hypothetical protein MJZ52_02385 [Bacteroidales bacterium]|nr:hypothetical protein [Bacteroidales bacterium]
MANQRGQIGKAPFFLSRFLTKDSSRLAMSHPDDIDTATIEVFERKVLFKLFEQEFKLATKRHIIRLSNL